VASARGHVVADIVEQLERAVEPLVGVALVDEWDEQIPAFVEQLCLEFVADACDLLSVLLFGVDVFEFGVEIDKAAADPSVERGDAWCARRVRLGFDHVDPRFGGHPSTAMVRR